MDLEVLERQVRELKAFQRRAEPMLREWELHERRRTGQPDDGISEELRKEIYAPLNPGPNVNPAAQPAQEALTDQTRRDEAVRRGQDGGRALTDDRVDAAANQQLDLEKANEQQAKGPPMSDEEKKLLAELEAEQAKQAEAKHDASANPAVDLPKQPEKV